MIKFFRTILALPLHVFTIPLMVIIVILTSICIFIIYLHSLIIGDSDKFNELYNKHIKSKF